MTKIRHSNAMAKAHAKQETIERMALVFAQTVGSTDGDEDMKLVAGMEAAYSAARPAIVKQCAEVADQIASLHSNPAIREGAKQAANFIRALMEDGK